jgi:RNA polymerase sigma-70 factor (ECF subfamily)
MASSDDNELLRLAVAGDRDALGELLQRYRPYLRMLARRQLDSALNARVDPSDIVQQTCLEAHRDFDAFQGGSERELIAWLRRMLEHNTLQSIEAHVHTKKRSVRRERVNPDSAATDIAFGGVAGRGSSPSRRAMRDELAVRIAAEIESLPDDQREAVRLRHIEGWSLAMLSRYFGRSESAVAGLVKRGLRTLREQLADMSGGPVG